MDELSKNNEIAEKVKLLFSFCAELIPHIETLEELNNFSRERTSTILSGAVLIDAMGGDYTEDHFEAKLRMERSESLLNLIKVLRDTEEERKKFLAKRKSKKANLSEIKKLMGV